MKTLLRTLGLFLVVDAFVMFAPAAPTQEKSGKVAFDEKGIVLHPGTQISKKDEQVLDAVLKKYDNRLYRIETYENGKLVKTQGQLKNRELKDVYVDDVVVAEVANAKAAGVTQSTVVIMIGKNDSSAPIVAHQMTHATKWEKIGKQLIAETKPILEKYTKQ